MADRQDALDAPEPREFTARSNAGRSLCSEARRPDRPFDIDELDQLNETFERLAPQEIIRWAAEAFGTDVVATASFGDVTLPHLVATSAAPGRLPIEVAFLDTQYHFAETLWLVERLQATTPMRLITVRPIADVVRDDLWATNVEQCCAVRKVEPLRRALSNRRAWITGLRRDDSPERANAPIVSWDQKFGVVKINPIATWTDTEVDIYRAMNDLPEHPLVAKGFPSIGCWPCTSPVRDGDDVRAGRWAGKAKTECGLHA